MVILCKSRHTSKKNAKYWKSGQQYAIVGKTFRTIEKSAKVK